VKLLDRLRGVPPKCRAVCHVLGPTLLTCDLEDKHDEGPEAVPHHDLARDKKWYLPKGER
jgi:hypothetical protein